MELRRTVSEVAERVGGRVAGPGDPASFRLEALRALETAGPGDLAPVLRRRGLAAAQRSAAGCLLVDATLPEDAFADRPTIRVDDANAALDVLTAASGLDHGALPPGVHPTAAVDPDATLGDGVAVGPHATVGAGARIGARGRLGPGCVVGAGAVVGADVRLGAHVVVGDRCRLGDRVVIHAGTVLGADGFGFRQDAEGRHLKSPQVGIVEIGDDVEIGACCTIDRARLEATVIGRGTKLDDAVHVAHNVVIGEHCALAARSAIAGSTTLGDRVWLAGDAKVVDGLHVGDGARLSASTLVTRDVAPGEAVAGIPARPRTAWLREVLSLERLPGLIARMKGRRGS